MYERQYLKVLLIKEKVTSSTKAADILKQMQHCGLTFIPLEETKCLRLLKTLKPHFKFCHILSMLTVYQDLHAVNSNKASTKWTLKLFPAFVDKVRKRAKCLTEA